MNWSKIDKNGFILATGEVQDYRVSKLMNGEFIAFASSIYQEKNLGYFPLSDEAIKTCEDRESNASRQRKFKAARAAKGLLREEYAATPVEHKALRKLLSELRIID